MWIAESSWITSVYVPAFSVFDDLAAGAERDLERVVLTDDADELGLRRGSLRSASISDGHGDGDCCENG